VVLAGLTWVIHDYFVTLEDEIRYIWTQQRGLGKFMFLWIRYFTIGLVLFDTLQIHTFSIPGVPTDKVCVIIAPITRILGAIILWSVEIIMQLRLYALYNQSRRVAYFNAVLFATSIGIYLWILVVNTMRRGEMIAFAKHLPLPGCPAINGGTEWALWIPPTVFEFVLFLFALYKGCTSIATRVRVNQRLTLVSVLIQGNVLYFFSIACLLIFNNLMVIGATKIPWFGFAPFHAAMGIVTCRMLIHLRQFNEYTLNGSAPVSKSGQTLKFATMKSGRNTQATDSPSTAADVGTTFKDKDNSSRSIWLDSGSETTARTRIRSDIESHPLPVIRGQH